MTEVYDKHREMASKLMVTIARDLRLRCTTTEERMWQVLRNRRLAGYKFRRQHPIAGTSFVVDFLCYEAGLIVEVDGGIHKIQVQQDQQRQAAIIEKGYYVHRFTNQQVEMDLKGVIVTLLGVLQALTPAQ